MLITWTGTDGEPVAWHTVAAGAVLPRHPAPPKHKPSSPPSQIRPLPLAPQKLVDILASATADAQAGKRPPSFRDLLAPWWGAIGRSLLASTPQVPTHRWG